MTPARWAAGLALLITTMLLQATFVGPLLVPLPASLPLVAIAAVAVLAGPSTGITLGFAGGLLADLGSQHPVGVLALTWLAVGLAGGVLGGMVVPVPSPTSASAPRRTSVRRGARRGPAGGDRLRRPASGEPAARRRAQALLVGGLAGAGAVATALLLSTIGSGPEPLATMLVRCAPAAVLDAILALLVMPVLAGALRSPTLRSPAAVEPHRPAGTLAGAR